MLSQHIRSGAVGSGSLLDSIDAVRNWRAVLLYLASSLSGSLVAGFSGSLLQTNYVLAIPIMLLALAAAFYGTNAAGVMMMDEAKGYPSRPVGEAVATSMATSHRLILLLLIVAGIYVLGILAFALLLFLCRLPGVGPFLYALVFPAGVVVGGIAILAVPTVVFPLSAPAIWSGATTLEGVGHVMTVARKRLLLVLPLMFAVLLVAFTVAMLIAVILVGGAVLTVLLSAPILGFDLAALGDVASGVVAGRGIGGGLANYVAAAIPGFAIVYTGALTLPGLVCLRGASSVYLRVLEGLDLAPERGALREEVAAPQPRAKEFQLETHATAQPYAPWARAAIPAVASAGGFSRGETLTGIAVASTSACPRCRADIVPGDVFCGNCGHRFA